MCLPFGSGVLRLLVDHSPPEAIVVAVATCVAPSNTCTSTSVASLASPLNDGSVFFDGVGGPTIDTTGDSVSTSKDTLLLVPFSLPRPLFSVA